jgi:hypothetical protein
VAAAAVAYLVLAFLFDVSSFPHTPYILVSLAGLLAVMLSQPEEEPRSGPAHVGGHARRPRPPRVPLHREPSSSQLRTRR